MIYYDENGIKCYHPDSSDTIFYLCGESSFDTIMEEIKSHFGYAVRLRYVSIEPVSIKVFNLNSDEDRKEQYSTFIRVSTRSIFHEATQTHITFY